MTRRTWRTVRAVRSMTRWVSASSRSLSGIRTSSKNTSLNPAEPIICRSGRTVTPGEYYLPGTVGETAAQCNERGRESGGSGELARLLVDDDGQLALDFRPPKPERKRKHSKGYW